MTHFVKFIPPTPGRPLTVSAGITARGVLIISKKAVQTFGIEKTHTRCDLYYGADGESMRILFLKDGLFSANHRPNGTVQICLGSFLREYDMGHFKKTKFIPVRQEDEFIELNLAHGTRNDK
jgi:hypothetical protein